MRKAKARTIYPSESLWNRVGLIAEEANNVPSRIAVTLIRRGVRKWERRKQTRPEKAMA
jgi:hypothetical protein